MQHNWTLAILEHAGILSRDEAQELSDEIKQRIHKENYVDTYREVQTVLNRKDLLEKFNRLKSLSTDVSVLAKKVESLVADKESQKAQKVSVAPVTVPPKK